MDSIAISSFLSYYIIFSLLSHSSTMNTKIVYSVSCTTLLIILTKIESIDTTAFFFFFLLEVCSRDGDKHSCFESKFLRCEGSAQNFEAFY